MKMSAFLRLRQSACVHRPISKRLLMKSPFSAAFALSIVLLAPSCVPDPYYTQPHHPPSGGHRPPGGGAAANAYNTGHTDGTRDRERGRRYNPQPGQNRFPSTLRDDYRRGYDAGYRHHGGGGSSGWTQRRAYDDGQNHGRRDKISGLSRNSDRHLRDVPRPYHSEFRRGYTAGWNAAPIGRPSYRPGPVPRPTRPVPY